MAHQYWKYATARMGPFFTGELQFGPRKTTVRHRIRAYEKYKDVGAPNGVFDSLVVTFTGQKIVSVVTVNGVRVTLEDGTWGLVRASSNKPSLVVVVESPTSEANMRAMFTDIDARLSKHPSVGEYDQKI